MKRTLKLGLVVVALGLFVPTVMKAQAASGDGSAGGAEGSISGGAAGAGGGVGGGVAEAGIVAGAAGAAAGLTHLFKQSSQGHPYLVPLKAPEISGSGTASGLALLFGGTMILRGRRRHSN